MSIRAYQQTANRTADPRDVEYRLFGQVTQALIGAQQAEKHEISKVIDALDWNRRVWSAMAMDCASDGNTLPEETRAGIISLSIFVSKHSSVAARERGEIETLIDINRSIMQGLAAAAGKTPEQAEAAIA